MVGTLIGSALFAGSIFQSGNGNSPLLSNYVSEFSGPSSVSWPLSKTIKSTEAGNVYEEPRTLPYLLETVIAPHFAIYETIHAAELRGADADWRFGWGAFFTPQVDLRMYGDSVSSVPVRRPNYKPHLTLESRWFNSFGSKYFVHVFEVEGTFIHYSDGQDGCLFREATQTISEYKHVPVRTCHEVPDGTVNTLDGEYTSTYLIAGGGYKVSRVTERLQNHFALVSARVEWHPPWGVTGSETTRQRYVYDRNAKTDIELRFGYLREGHWPGMVTGLVWSRFPNLNETAAGHVTPYGFDTYLGLCLPRQWDVLKDWSLMAGMYFGQDRMNVDFRQNTSQFHVGLRYSPDFQDYAVR
jgi:hypothetical protein